MSQFCTVKTKILDVECLKDALKELKLNYEENSKVLGHDGEKRDVDIQVKFDNTKYGIGFKKAKAEDFYEMSCDWWCIRNNTEWTQKSFTDQVTRKYAEVKIKKELAFRGYSVVNEEVSENEELVLTVRSW